MTDRPTFGRYTNAAREYHGIACSPHRSYDKTDAHSCGSLMRAYEAGLRNAQGEVEARARKIYDDLCDYAERNSPHVNDAVNAKIAVLREVLNA